MSRILLLEDDLSLIDGLSYSLKKQGFETDIARTVKEANSLWSNGKYGLLVTSNWGANWQPPLAVLAVTILAALLTTFISVLSPAKRIEEMSIVNVVNAG